HAQRAARASGLPRRRPGRPPPGAPPRPATSFVGRPEECEQVAVLLRGGRLVTITGEGGLGKTRRALEVAPRASLADYPDGVWFCDVSSVRDADGLAEHLAASMRVTLSSGGDAPRALLAAPPAAPCWPRSPGPGCCWWWTTARRCGPRWPSWSVT